MSITPPANFNAEDFPNPIKKMLADRKAASDSMPFHIAMIVDGTVIQALHVDERFAAAYLSSPTFVQCKGLSEGGPDAGWSYDSEKGTFTAPTE